MSNSPDCTMQSVANSNFIQTSNVARKTGRLLELRITLTDRQFYDRAVTCLHLVCCILRLLVWAITLNPLTSTLKLHSNGLLYSNTVIVRLHGR